MKKFFKVLGIILLILVILTIIVIASGYFFIKSKLNKMQQVEINVNELNVSDVIEQNLHGYRNVAIYGVDSRDSSLGKGNRSDCIIIASINNSTKEIKLISVYRDTYVNIEGYGLDKITHAYSYGGPELALKTLNENLDLNITEFVTVNFDALADAINCIGGVDINIEENEIQYLNNYLAETSKVTGLETKKVTNTGLQTLDGVQAVAYSRIRYTEGGDYKRTERMRTVIEAMFDKLKTKSLGEINNLVDHLLPEVYTNLEPDEIIALAPTILQYSISDSIGWPYNVKGITTDRWYGVPVTLEENVKQLHEEAFGEENYTPSETVQEISDRIIERTGYTD